MNVTEEMTAESSYGVMFKSPEASLRIVFGEAETFCCCDAYQFAVYSKVIMEYMDPARRADRREKVFPEDCRRVFEFGRRLASEVS